MKNVLILSILLISNNLNSYSIPNQVIDTFEYNLPAIEVQASCVQCKIKTLKDSINNIDLTKLTKLTDEQLIYKYLPGANHDLRDYQKRNYISIVKMAPVWDYLLIKYKIPKFISISFWIEETGWGKSKLFINHYNLGGIKCHSCSDAYRAKDDCGDDFCKFRKFNTLIEGIDFWAKVLTKDRYLKHIVESEDYQHHIKAYKKGGYWTSSSGVINRISHCRKLKLDKL